MEEKREGESENGKGRHPNTKSWIRHCKQRRKNIYSRLTKYMRYGIIELFWESYKSVVICLEI